MMSLPDVLLALLANFAWGFILLAPILASKFGIMIFGDHLGWKIFVGGLLTLFGILILSIRFEPKRLKNRSPHRKVEK